MNFHSIFSKLEDARSRKEYCRGDRTRWTSKWNFAIDSRIICWQKHSGFFSRSSVRIRALLMAVVWFTTKQIDRFYCTGLGPILFRSILQKKTCGFVIVLNHFVIGFHHFMSFLWSSWRRGEFLSWIDSFLSDLGFSVEVGWSFSSLRHVKTGVPQGSALGPILFLIYSSDLLVILSFFNWMCADDTMLYSFSTRTSSHREICCSYNSGVRSGCFPWNRRNVKLFIWGGTIQEFTLPAAK